MKMNLELLEKDFSSNIKGSTRFEEQSLTHLSLSGNCSLQHPNESNENKVSDFDGELQDESKRKKRGKNGTHRKVCARGHWRPSEDAKLKELVSQFGPQNWNLISQHLLGRSGKSCRLRWFNQLDPRINKRAFTEEEEEKLLSAHRAYGNKWAMISRLFPGRTDNSVKNHWHVIMARKLREQQQSSSSLATAVKAEMTSLPSTRGSFVINGDEIMSTSNDGEDESAASTCTTDLSLTPPSAHYKPRMWFSENALPPGERSGKWMEHQKRSHGHEDEDISVDASLTLNNNNIITSFHFFDFLGLGASS